MPPCNRNVRRDTPRSALPVLQTHAACGRCCMTLKAVITTMDNLPLLQRQVPILQEDPLVGEIIVVNNGSEDGTQQWLSYQPPTRRLKIINRENCGAGPGRNAGLDAAGYFDFVLMLDGGILPLRGGTQQMLAYLQRRPDAAVVGVDHSDTVTEEAKASVDWLGAILDADTYWNRCLSQTHYCLARNAAFDGLRFSEEGPFGEPGWGADDNEMACQWLAAGIVVHVVQKKIQPYRRGSGSFERLFRETGIWPNAYGSVYEQRVVWTQQNWPQYLQGIQWGEPWLTVIVADDGDVERTIRLVKHTHDLLRLRHFTGKWSSVPNPYSIVVWAQPEIGRAHV